MAETPTTSPNTPEKSPTPASVYVLLVLTILFFLGLGFTAYLYYTQLTANNTLRAEISSLEDDVQTLTVDRNSLDAANTELTEDNDELEAENEDYVTRMATIETYNDFNTYVFDVVSAHGGFYNLTEEEYQTALSYADATGDTEMRANVEWAWNEISVPHVTRFVTVMNYSFLKIAENL